MGSTTLWNDVRVHTRAARAALYLCRRLLMAFVDVGSGVGVLRSLGDTWLFAVLVTWKLTRRDEESKRGNFSPGVSCRLGAAERQQGSYLLSSLPTSHSEHRLRWMVHAAWVAIAGDWRLFDVAIYQGNPVSTSGQVMKFLCADLC